MNEKLQGIIYIIIAILIIVIMLEVPWFYVYLIWIIAIGLIIAGVYLLIFKK
ncbi:MAG: hypothetical protein ACLQG5_10235 [Methanobacterium sp.]